MPITGKEMVKLALANGWIEVRKRGSHHHFNKRLPAKQNMIQ